MITGNTASGTFYVFNKKEQFVPIVFIHGVGLTYEIWQPQLDFFKDYSNLSYDILGHGKSSLTKQNISFDDFSDQLIELINELKIEKIHLVGFSIGSLIARWLDFPLLLKMEYLKHKRLSITFVKKMVVKVHLEKLLILCFVIRFNKFY